MQIGRSRWLVVELMSTGADVAAHCVGCQQGNEESSSTSLACLRALAPPVPAVLAKSSACGCARWSRLQSSVEVGVGVGVLAAVCKREYCQERESEPSRGWLRVASTTQVLAIWL